MRRLLNTLFVLSEDSYLSLKNDNIVIQLQDGKKQAIPLIGLEEIFCFSYKGASPDLIGACAERGIGFTFLSPRGRYRAKVSGRPKGNVLLRKALYRKSDSEEQSCFIARNLIYGKIHNCRWSIERTLRDHELRVDAGRLKRVSLHLREASEKVLTCEKLDEVRGIEGESASLYFGCFDEMVLNQKEKFVFLKRSRRPPLDRVNAMLSFGYSILESECATALESVGLDAYVGFLHRDRPGRESLALDLMEEMRPVLVDRQVLTLINTKAINENCFREEEGGAVLLNDKGRRVFLEAWQTHKKAEIRHPYLNEKMQWGLLPYVQALLLARYLRGDLDAYPPFLWK